MIQRRRGILFIASCWLVFVCESSASSQAGARGTRSGYSPLRRHRRLETQKVQVETSETPVRVEIKSTPAGGELVSTIDEEGKGKVKSTEESKKTTSDKKAAAEGTVATQETKKHEAKEKTKERENEPKDSVDSATEAPVKDEDGTAIEVVEVEARATAKPDDASSSKQTETIDTSTEAPADPESKKTDQTTEAPAATDAPNEDSETPAPTDDTDPCATASTCAACVSTALPVSTALTNDSTCIWKHDTCKMIKVDSSSATLTPAEMCGEAPKKSSTGGKEDEIYEDYDESGGPGVSFVLLLFFMSGFMLVKAYNMQQSGHLPAGFLPHGAIQRSTSRGHYTERVPLSSNHDDDEWGWEDSDAGGDVEMSTQTRRHEKQEDDDLQMALALSLSERSKRSNTSGQARDVVGRSGSGNAQEERNARTNNARAPPRTNAGLQRVIQPVSKRQEKPKRREEDDIFASMGLSAKPKFSKPSASSRETAMSGSSALAATDVDAETGSDWGDDADLDDLLND